MRTMMKEFYYNKSTELSLLYIHPLYRWKYCGNTQIKDSCSVLGRRNIQPHHCTRTEKKKKPNPYLF